MEQLLSALKNYKFDIIVLAGQSNAEGNGFGNTPIAENNGQVFQLSDKNVASFVPDPATPIKVILNVVFPLDLYFGLAKERIETYRKESMGELSLTFANEYIKAGLLSEGRNLLIVKTPAGGTGFARKEWGLGSVLYKRLIEMTDIALSANPENRLVAFLWHQGEHDAYENAHLSNAERYEFYKENFMAQMNDYRAKYGNVPIICGEFQDDWTKDYQEQSDVVEKCIKDCCEILGNACMVSSQGLPSNDMEVGNKDNAHFCRWAIYELGRRYFKGYESLK